MRVPEISSSLIQVQQSQMSREQGKSAPESARLAVARPHDAFEPTPPNAQASLTSSAISAANAQPLYAAADRDALLEKWGMKTGDDGFDAQYDLDADGKIGSKDLALLLGAMSQAPLEEAAEPTPMPFEVGLEAILNAWGAKAGEEGFDERLDLDGDGVIGSADLARALGGEPVLAPPRERDAGEAPSDTGPVDKAAVLAAWGAREGDERYDAALDVDGDGVIGSADLAHTLGAWRDGSTSAEGGGPVKSAAEAREEAIQELLKAWGAKFGRSGFDAKHDLDGNGVIGSADLAQLLGSFRQ